MPPDSDLSAFVPTSVVPGVIAAATRESIVLSLGRRVPMPSGKATVPILSALPTAAFTNGVGGRKHYTSVDFGPGNLVAEEVAATIAVPDAYLEDATIDLWGVLEPELAGAIGRAVDDAVIDGVGAPPSFPVGGIKAVAGAALTGADILEAAEAAMGAVEATGLEVTAFGARPAVRGMLRGLKGADGKPLTSASVTEAPAETLYGLPIAYGYIDATTGDIIAGDWRLLVVGVRNEIRYERSTEGVIADAAGKVLVSAFQDDSTLMRVYMRLAVAIGTPITPEGTGKPFAIGDATA